MDSIRKWFYRPKRRKRTRIRMKSARRETQNNRHEKKRASVDVVIYIYTIVAVNERKFQRKVAHQSPLAQFFYADEALNAVACELDSFDGRQEPERCSSLVNQLRHCQDKVLNICNHIMDELIPDERANRDFRVKFPDDVMQENLAGQLWFGAECLAAGSSILNRETESSAMRPLAKALTKSLENVRNLLRDQALRGQMNLKASNPLDPSVEKLVESLKIFDRLFADFELCYVGAMVPVKTTKEYEQQELVCVLFSETLQRALERGLLSQADVDNYEPALMFTIPRLAIVAGLLAPPGGPLCLNSPDNISEMFRLFRSLLMKIRELLWTLNNRELYMLEKLLCSIEETSPTMSQAGRSACDQVPDLDEFVCNFYTGYPNCKHFLADFYTVTRNNGANMDEIANDAVLILEKEKTELPLLDSPVSDVALSTRQNSSDSSDVQSYDSSFEIPRNRTAQYLLNQVRVDRDTRTTPSQSDPHAEHRASSSPDIDSRKLIEEANKNLSNLLLEANDCQNENSEQTDSGICTVISSENTSLYDKSPEDKRSFDEDCCNDSSDHQQQLLDEEEEENTSYSCSNLNSPRRRDSNQSDTSCVCRSKVKNNPQNYIQLSLDSGEKTANHSGLSSQMSGSNEEIIGVAYGSGQLPVCDGNQHPAQQQLQIGYSENWDSLNINIGSSNPSAASSSRREFWSELKCENCPQRATHRPRSSRRSHHQSLHHKQSQGEKNSSRRKVAPATASSRHLQAEESAGTSRNNSTDRVNKQARLMNLGASLHPSHNSRQMPRFGRSPNASPRMQHFATDQDPDLQLRLQQQHYRNGRKLLENRRLRRERTAYRHYKRNRQAQESERALELINDGLGPRTNKSGTVDPPRHGPRAQLADASTATSRECCDSSSETSEFQSDCQDDEEIALAMQAAEIANRNKIRAKFRSSEDLVHRLFVCIAGVADQLQTNFASDLRNILKCVFLMNSSQAANEEEEQEKTDSESPNTPVTADPPTNFDSTTATERQDSAEEDESDEPESNEEPSSPLTERGEECVERAPVWVPDSVAPRCMACQAGFTVVRRRHHCRNCGKVFCGRCSGNSVPLPRFGHTKPVRVCNRCFLYQVTPFTVTQMASTS
uniref:Lateral signaling target protein 2 homolog n=1 Tax=Trichogramma kaykai TaxID=54128 RepID=A0ABD2XHH9_9HYME